MATTKENKDFILEQLDYITCRPMMGGYLISYKGVMNNE